MEQITIIGRELLPSELNEIRQSTASVYCLTEKSPVDGATVVILSADEKREINYSVLDEIKNLGDKVIDGQSLSARLRVEKSSIWHYHKFRTYFFVRNLDYDLAKLSKIRFSATQKARFYCPGEFRFLNDEFPHIEFVFPQRKKEKLNLLLSFKYLTFVKLRTFSSWFTLFSKSDVLIYYPERYNPLLDIKSLRPRRGNFLLDYLFVQAHQPMNLISEVPVPKLKSSAAFPFQKEYFRRKESGHPRKNMESVWFCYALGAWLKARKAGKNLQGEYALILNSPLTRNEKMAIRFVRSLHGSSVFYLTRYFAAKRFFKKHRFRVLLATDENSPLTKTVVDAAKFYGIKTVGMQHGTMHDLHPAYLYTKKDIADGIIPDFTLTWGSYWAKFLVEKGNYPAESVVSVGHLRTDIVPRLLARRSEGRRRFNLVFASQPQRDPVLRRQAAFDVFSAARQFPELDLVVKLHPREFDEVDYYSAIADEAGCTNYRIDKETDLYALIASCNALITCFSTVGTETIYFSKPLIILDHLMQDIQGYCREGVAFRVTNTDELTSILSGLQNGFLQINKPSYNEFIQKYSYKIDGKVAERVEEFLSRI